MRNKLLVSTAALLAGVALASAQSMQGGGEQRGGAAQGQQSQSSPQQGQSQQAPQGKQQGQSQREQKKETTGQSQRQQDQQAQPQRQQRDQTQGQAPQRQQGQQGQTGQAPQQGQTQPSQAPQQGQAQQGQAQQGQAGGSVNLTTQQRTEIRQTVLAGGNVPRVNNVNFSVRVGTTVPTSVRIVEVPPALIEIHPQWRGHMYFVVGDQIIIVDRNHRIIAIIDV
jgi:Protein of unknown function (DUF1236)